MDKVKESKTKYVHDLAESICKKYKIHYYKGQVLWQDKLNFSADPVLLMKKVVGRCKVSPKTWQDVKTFLPVYATWVDEEEDFFIQLNNGIIKEGKFVDESNNAFTIFNLPISYNPDAYDEHVDKFLNFVSCDDRDLRNVLEEIIGHILLIKDFPQNFFFMTGDGHNGKSTFIEMLKAFAGTFTSTIDFDDFNSTVHAHKLIGKLLNIGDDADNVYLDKAKTLKSMASGNSISVRALFEAPITMNNTATLIFTANDPPSFKDKSFGIIRRLKVVPFRATIVKKELGYLSRLRTASAKEYMLRLAFEGIERILANDLEISRCAVIDEHTDKYHVENDSVLSWEKENPINIEIEVRLAYNEYVRWCKECGFGDVSINKFSRRMHKKGYKSVEHFSEHFHRSMMFYQPFSDN